MNAPTGWENLAASAVLAFVLVLIVRWMLGRFTRILDCLKETLERQQRLLEEIEKSMMNRDQIILNHLERFQMDQDSISRLLKRLCEAWDVCNGRS